MSGISARIWLLLTTFFCTFALSQAQTPQLPWPNPQNFYIYDDALHWDAIEHASGYRIRRLGISDRDRIEVVVSQNRFDLSDLRYDYTYFTDIQAISGDPTQYADSGYSPLFYLIRPYPTATPTSTPTATPSPTPTRVFLQGIGTPQNLRPLSGATVAWDPVVGAVSYSVFISGGGEIHGASVFAPQTELTLTGLAAGVTYSVQVSAQGDGQRYELQGRWSKHINVTISSAATETPIATSSNTPTPRPTDTATFTPTSTSTPSPTPTPTDTATDTPPPTHAATNTPTATNSPTAASTDSATLPATATELIELPAPQNLIQIGPRAIAWDVVEGAASYRVRWELPDGSRDTVSVANSQLQYTLVGIPADVTVKVKVRALGDGLVYVRRGPWTGFLPLGPVPPATASQTPSAEATDTATATNTDKPSPSETPTITATSMPTDTATFTPTDTPTNTPIPTKTPKPTRRPTDRPTPKPTKTNTPRPPTSTYTPIPTNTPVPTATTFYYGRSETRTESGDSSQSALKRAREAAKNAVRCSGNDSRNGEVRFVNEIIEEVIGGTRWNATVTAILPCRRP